MSPASAEDNAQAREDRLARLAAFSKTIKDLRAKAINARKQMGIEEQWQEDEDFYEGIDDASRTTASRTKPYDFGGTGTGPTKAPSRNDNRSTVFVPMTRPYVDIAAARISDMYMPTSDRNWDGEPTAIPDLVEALDDKTPVAGPDGNPLLGHPAPVMLAQQPMAGPDGQVMMQQQPVTVADQAQAVIDAANKAWVKARTQIDDWHQECGYNAELRKVIKDMARIGVGILKGPFPQSKTAKAVRRTAAGFALEIEQKLIPASKRVDPWRFFPDPACGENINKGSYVFEQDFSTRSKLRDLKKDETYIAEAIDACLEEGPVGSQTGTKQSQAKEQRESDLFEVWYFEGQVEWQDLTDCGCKVSGEKGDVFSAFVTMINERVVKATISHLDSQEFTYDVAVWQQKCGLWIGDGVGRQGRTAQQGLNAAVRNLMDNAGQSSRPHKVFNRKVISAGPDPWTWYMNGDADVSAVAHAMMFFTVPSMQVELMNIINYFGKLFEDSTGLPMLLQGQQGSAPETVGGMEMLQNNAGIVPRDIVRRIDDSLTDPHVNRYYEYLLIHGEDDSAKGDFQIHARGSSALMERQSQTQFLMQIGQLVANPNSELDMKLYVEELLKAQRISPDRLRLTDERKKELAQRQAPEDPRVTAAKIMASARMQGKQLDAKEAADHAAADAHLAMNQQAFDADQAEKDRQLQLVIQQSMEHIQAQKTAGASEQTIQTLKTELAEKVMALNTEKELATQANVHENDRAVASHMVALHKHHTPAVMAPPVQVPGRAADGHAFDQTSAS